MTRIQLTCRSLLLSCVIDHVEYTDDNDDNDDDRIINLIMDYDDTRMSAHCDDESLRAIKGPGNVRTIDNY